MYGAVPLREIKRTLLELRAAGKLDRVRMLMLTNCTFDGLVYDVERVMEECLAIKPDLVFLWDEAWFAFARFHPVYRSRTAMSAAGTLLARLRDPAYHTTYATDTAAREAVGDVDTALDTRLLPDPERARVRVYATQPTRKTLTSLRQGSMIHIFDQDYGQKAEETFHEAYMATPRPRRTIKSWPRWIWDGGRRPWRGRSWDPPRAPPGWHRSAPAVRADEHDDRLA